MHTDQILLAELAALLLSGNELSSEQSVQLDNLLNKYPDANRILLNIIQAEEIVTPYDVRETNIDKAFDKFKENYHAHRIPKLNHITYKKSYNYAKWIGIAASFILILGIFYLWILQVQSSDFIVEDKVYGQKNDVLPGRFFAKLSIDGKRDILLDNSKKYNEFNKHSSEHVHVENGTHILTVPSRATYELLLSDGSIVWISPNSRLEYEGGFSKNERRLKLTGEAYFKVAKDVNRPFIVDANGMEIQALGTQFNVKAYHNNPIVQLAEGRIKVSKSFQSVYINAGHQVQLDKVNLKIGALRNIEEATSWKEGKFSFDNKDLKQIMEEIGRWYGVDVDYDTQLAEKRYQGTIDRNVTLAQLCSLLQELTGYKFIIENDKLAVRL